jgi:hypothetical protein
MSLKHPEKLQEAFRPYRRGRDPSWELLDKEEALNAQTVETSMAGIACLFALRSFLSSFIEP